MFLISEHDSGMVQLQVNCYKKKVSKDAVTTIQLESQNRDDCDIISELLFHNDGASDTPKNQQSRLASSSPARSVNGKDETSGFDNEDVIRSNIVMFEFRDQISNLTDQDIGPFASFFENDYDFLEQVIILFRYNNINVYIIQFLQSNRQMSYSDISNFIFRKIRT